LHQLRRVHINEPEPAKSLYITSRRHEAAAILTFHDETENEITFLKGVTGKLADALYSAMRIISGWAKSISTIKTAFRNW
jgi:hypothetical protein